MQISTEWSGSIDRDLPLNEYPRPAGLREFWQNLNGSWECRFGDSPWQTILVPFAPETALSGVERILQPDETLTYRRIFTLPESWWGQRICLNFEAVDYACRCRINNKDAGSHVGGYLPFSFDITNYLSRGENELILEVTDPTDTGPQARGKQVLNPRTIWYTPTSGIWQTVWLEPVNPVNHIIDFQLSPDPGSSQLNITVETLRPGTVRVRYSGNPDVSIDVEGASGANLVLELPGDLLRWNPDNPVLHPVTLEVLESDEVVDSMESYFALRTLEKSPGRDGRQRLMLNGAPIFLNGPLDQGYWPESGLTPPSEEAILFDLEKTKELGFNMTRKHIKVEPRRWYYHADRLGLAVIQDMVSGGEKAVSGLSESICLFNRGRHLQDNSSKVYKRIGRSRPEDRKAVETEMMKMLNHLYNYPSILVWVPFNEGWGQFDADRIGSDVSRKDPTRLVDYASGWLDPGSGDFRSLHTYVVSLRPPGKPDGRVFYYSEYGGYNLAVPGHMWDEKKKYGYRYLTSREKLEQSYARLFRKQLIPLIRKGLSAAVYTQFADVEIESNGYYTYDRKVLKMDAGFIRKMNSEVETVYQAEWEKHHG